MVNMHFITIVLDGEPWIRRHLEQFERLSDYGIDWTWHIREGASANVNCTKWCRPQKPRFSTDGTHEYLASLFHHPNIDIRGKQIWNGGKVEMFNDALLRVNEPCILMQIDSDELWSTWQIAKIHHLFNLHPHACRAYFYCNYFVGPDIITLTPNAYGNNPGEWLRAWRYFPGMVFDSHEPPVLQGNKGHALDREFTKNEELVFDHMAYATERQVAFKESFYGYTDALACWRRLQSNKSWPIRLNKFLKWADPKAVATRIERKP